VEEVKEILSKNPDLDVHYQGTFGWSVLTVACQNDCNPIVSILLARPDIDVNLNDVSGSTAFSYSHGGSISCLRLLLKDQRVEVNQPDNQGYTPLRGVAYDGHLAVIKWWIASGREMDLGTPGDIDRTDDQWTPWDIDRTDAIGAAKEYGETEMVTLLERFQENPEETRHAIRLELGWYDEAAADVFAPIVFVSDGLLQIKATTPTPAARFLSIARRLPLELQMIVCYLVVGTPKGIIPGEDSEAAFKSLAQSLLWSSIFTSG